MYSFYLNNRREKGFAYIEHLEEKALYKLYQKKGYSLCKAVMEQVL